MLLARVIAGVVGLAVLAAAVWVARNPLAAGPNGAASASYGVEVQALVIACGAAAALAAAVLVLHGARVTRKERCRAR